MVSSNPKTEAALSDTLELMDQVINEARPAYNSKKALSAVRLVPCFEKLIQIRRLLSSMSPPN